MEQEKHSLKRRLESTESEYEIKVLEMQTDLRELRAMLDERENALKNAEREKALIISDLSEQNTRLTDRLREITLITERKTDLERRVQQLLDERESLNSALEESADRIVMLEKQHKEQDSQLRQVTRELDDLRTTNGTLCERLEALTPASSTTSSSAGHRSLLNEMEVSDTSLTQLHQQNSSEIECDDDILMDSSSMHSTELRSPGFLRNVVQQLSETLRLGDENGICPNCGHGPEQVERLETELHRAKEAADKAQRQLHDVQDELKRKTDECMNLTSKINSQLIEAVQQKVELSQQLEQWQMDMHHLLDEQMKKKLTTQEQRHRQRQLQSQQNHRRKSSRGQENDGCATDKRQNSRLFGFFNR
ncbi:hypothetical protein J437_LFUL016887 [Ladona fulva]|uniref:Bicaudal D-related protein 1 n=1 Tax=Ladona fulva TaxID=123851 RepID=A0A8K0KR41_LADFU|nr:hypothetical protein J437_LFUL016887 [Ladona fulva]